MQMLKQSWRWSNADGRKSADGNVKVIKNNETFVAFFAVFITNFSGISALKAAKQEVVCT